MSKLLLLLLIVLNIYIIFTVNQGTRSDMLQSVKDIPHYVSIIADSIDNRINGD